MPPPNPVLERFKFHTRSRQQRESMADFVASLRRLSEHCEFGDGLDDLLRDRLICDCNEDRLHKNLLATTPPPTFKVAIAMAQAMESADKDTKDLQSTRTAAEVHAIPRSSPPPRSQTRDCYRCGGKHTPWDCRFKDQSCRYCKKLGHIAKVCRKKAQQQKMRPDKRPTNKVEQSEDSDDSHTIHHMEGKGKSQPPYIVSVLLDGRSTQM